MFLILALLPVFVFASEGNINVDQNQPEQVNRAISKLVQLIDQKKPKVILLGEDHSDFVTKSFYKSVIEEVTSVSQKQVCYFLETDEAYQPAIDNLDPSKPATIECFESSHRILKQDFLEVFGKSPNHWLDIVKLAELKQKGVKIIAIDRTMTKVDLINLKKIVDEKSSKDPQVAMAAYQKFDDLIVRDRNKYMSEKMQEGIEKHNCEIGFFSVGSAHIFPARRMVGTQIPGLGEILPSELSFISVNAQTCKNDFDCKTEDRATINISLRP